MPVLIAMKPVSLQRKVVAFRILIEGLKASVMRQML
jgi:hypothetical protein